MAFRAIIFSLLVFLVLKDPAVAQKTSQADSLSALSGLSGLPGPSDLSNKNWNNPKFWAGTATLAVADIVSLVGLNALWYSDYDRSSFHFHNDWPNWQQQDKLGHAAAAWQIARLSSSFAEWAGLSKKSAAIYGFTATSIYQTQIELLDGFSAQWGASVGDAAFNFGGAFFGALEGVHPGPLAITMKYSYHKSDNYDNTTSIWGNTVKDYDGISHWLVLRPDLLSPSLEWWPAWLGLSVGHTADGLVTAKSTTENPHERIWMVGLDFDFLRAWDIQNPWLRTAARTLSFIRIPAPALQLGRNVKWVGMYY